MAPRKRAAAAAAASKKPPPSQPSQPAKFGILHFFERQSQAAPSQNARRQKPDANPDPMPPPPPPPPLPLPEEELSEVSPEVTKTLAPKRVKFSPGMLINQSQDDGGGEAITWKISPVNDRLRTRQLPGMALHPCSNNELIAGITGSGGPDQLGAGQHKKALLDLLDQVEDAITEEELPVDTGNKGEVISGDSTDSKCSSILSSSPNVESNTPLDAPYFDSFLVLEVSEKHKGDTSSCDRYPVKVLRVLNEYRGKEYAVHLCDEWFHSTVGPGDTVSVIGEFDDQGECIVDHDSNLVIIHPELLISGTRAGLLEDVPSRQFLEQQAKEVLLNNIESLYACGASDSNTYSILIEAIPKMLNWFERFMKVMDIEEMAWAPRYGLKGIIDASVISRVNSCDGGSHDSVMPLEFKTGKSTSGQVLSTQSGRIAVANGSIRDISRSHITVSLSRRLRLPGSSSLLEQGDLQRELWRIDKDEFSSSFATMRLNLVQLFAQKPQNTELRKLVVDLEAPRFDSGGLLSQDPALSYIRSLTSLNNDQQRSLHKILAAKDYALILGMPGTGKTYTMVHAVKSLLMRGESILLTSYTNSAIDNLLMKLKAEITKQLLKRGIAQDEIGIITPYNAQADLIRQQVDALVEVHTIDKYQKKLIMVGSAGTLSTIPLLKLLVEKVAERGGLVDLTNKDVQSIPELRTSRLNAQ
ncbi:hypothetical protein ACQ4PT_053562 [Festuca glaucescens]